MRLLTSIVHIFSWAIHPIIECSSSSYTSGIQTKTYSHQLNFCILKIGLREMVQMWIIASITTCTARTVVSVSMTLVY